MLVGGIYLFFGIAILALCFDLIQETLIIKFANISERIKNNSNKKRFAFFGNQIVPSEILEAKKRNNEKSTNFVIQKRLNAPKAQN